MNFYPHHIGDYMTATAHLSWHEDCAYRRLLDVYYSREQAIPADLNQACRLVRASSKDEKKAVETVLTEFFTRTETGWAHPRCEEEIAKAQDAAERARANGKKGGRPPKEKPRANPDETQPVSDGNPEKSNSKAPNPNPITNPSYSVTTDVVTAGAAGKSPDAMTKEELWSAGKAYLESQGMARSVAGSFIGGLVDKFGPDAAVTVLRQAIVETPAEPKAWMTAACQRIAGTRKTPNRQEAIEQRNHAGAEAWAAQGGINGAH